MMVGGRFAPGFMSFVAMLSMVVMMMPIMSRRLVVFLVAGRGALTRGVAPVTFHVILRIHDNLLRCLRNSENAEDRD